MASDDDRRKKPLKLKTSSFDRNFAMARMGVIAGTNMAGHTFGNLFRSKDEREERNREFYVEQAQFLADELGRLKGSVMKAGQMLSLYGQYFLPEEAVEVLSGLQDDTAPVAWKVVAPVLEKSLGRQRLAELEIEETPLAAASLGQAHRAVRATRGPWS